MAASASIGRIYAASLIATMVGFAIVSMVFGVFGQVEVSSNENRRLTGLPGWPHTLDEWQSLPQRFDAFFDDNFGLRRLLLKINADVSTLMLGRLPTDRVLVGKDGWLFFAAEHSLELYRNERPLDDVELERWRRAIAQREQELGKDGAGYLFTIAPDKHTVYPEQMPASMRRRDRPSQYDQIVAMARQAGLPVVDLRSALNSGKSDGRLVYLRYDSHWNDWGAYLAYKAIMELVGTASGGAHVLGLTPDQFGEQTVGSEPLAQMAMLDRTELVAVAPALLRCPVQSVAEQPIHAHESGTVRWKCSGASGKLLFVGDSFGEALQKFFAQSFAEVVFVYRPFFRSQAEMDDYVQREHPDFVIEELVERHIAVGPISPPGGQDQSPR